MKLKEWAEKTGVKYLTAWRWFKDGTLPVKAYQTDSGTIIVQDDPFLSENTVETTSSSNDVMTAVLKKTVEFSKSNAPIEEFAAWILSNFTLRPNTQSDTPKYSRVKPKPEQIQDHFKQFLKPKREKPKPNMFMADDPSVLDDLLAQSDDLTAKELVEEISKVGASAGAPVNPTDAPEVEDLMKDLSSAMSTLSQNPNFGSVSIVNYDDLSEGVVSRSVDLTPQPIDYTSSTNYSFSTGGYNSLVPATSTILVANTAPPVQTSTVTTTAFQPTQKELESAARISSTLAEKPRRGRKSLKGKK